jgi:putative ABC transport system permease protein
MAAGEVVRTEVNDREIEVVGLYEMGTSFGIDASILTSADNFLRLFPNRPRTQIDYGLIRIEPGADLEAVRSELERVLPDDVNVFTREQFVAREHAYWDSTTPIGFVFAFGSIIGVVVGAIIVYQILFADVSDHIAEYATLKAMGYSNRYMSWVVIQQSVILGALGFVPGVVVCLWLYRLTGEATHLPMFLTWERAVGVLALTIGMCAVSGLLALRKIRALDPAEIF